MISYKGRIGFIQYMPKKPKKWGLKAFALSDSHSGYVYNWHLYTGKFSMLCVCVWVCVWESVLPLPHLNRKRWLNMDNGMTHWLWNLLIHWRTDHGLICVNHRYSPLIADLGVVYMLPKVVEELLEKRSDFE